MTPPGAGPAPQQARAGGPDQCPKTAGVMHCCTVIRASVPKAPRRPKRRGLSTGSPGRLWTVAAGAAPLPDAAARALSGTPPPCLQRPLQSPPAPFRLRPAPFPSALSLCESLRLRRRCAQPVPLGERGCAWRGSSPPLSRCKFQKAHCARRQDGGGPGNSAPSRRDSDHYTGGCRARRTPASLHRAVRHVCTAPASTSRSEQLEQSWLRPNIATDHVMLPPVPPSTAPSANHSFGS